MSYVDYFIEEIERRAKIDRNPSPEQFRERLEHYGKETSTRAIRFITDIRSRSAKNTEIVFGEPDERQRRFMEGALEHITQNVLVSVEGILGQNEIISKQCRLYVDGNYSRIPFMWRELLFPAKFGRKPDFITLTLPGHHSLIRTSEGNEELKVLRFPEKFFTLISGTDYCGENKKAFLTMLMHHAKQNGMLGLHAGTKDIYFKGRNGELAKKGIVAFGLSGTGKTTLMCNNHNLDQIIEGTIFRQDDIVMMDGNGGCYGTEDNFYIKSEGLDKESQRMLWEAAMTNKAIHENVYVDPETGELDFNNYSLTWRGKEGRNGRIIVYRKDMIPYTESSIDLEKADIVLFICPSYSIDYPVVKLESAEWAAAALALGETVGTVAQSVEGIGKPKHEIAFNPFIIGSPEDDIHRFYEFVRRSKSDGRPIECYILNTGYVGVKGMDDKGKPLGGEKITVLDSAKIIEQIARDGISWRCHDFWKKGYMVPESIDGIPSERLKLLNPRIYYSEEDYRSELEKKREDRLGYLSRFDLNKEIVDVVKG